MADFSNLFKVEACHHELFPHEEDYMMCPNCGDIIWTNIPKGADFEQFFKQQKRVKRLFNQELEKKAIVTFALLAPLTAFTLDVVTITLFKIGEKYDYNTFSQSLHDLPFQEIFALTLGLVMMLLRPVYEFRKLTKDKLPTNILTAQEYLIISSWRRWIRCICISIFYYISAQWFFNYIVRHIRYEKVSQIFADSSIRNDIIDSYYQSGWYYFNIVFLLYVVYVAFCCYRQRLVLRINEFDYLSEE